MIALIRQFALFCGVGLINTAIGFGIIVLCSEVLGLNYIVSNMIGYGVGLSIGFWLHKHFTFRETSALTKTRHQMLGFLTVFVFAYLSQLGLLIYLKEAAGLHNILSQAVACGFYVLISFAGNRLGTFRTPAP